MVREQLKIRAAKFNLVLDDVSITHVTFSPEFSSAVEAKQIAQQDAQRGFYIVDRAKQEKQSIIVKAEGESKSAELIGEIPLPRVAVSEQPAAAARLPSRRSDELCGLFSPYQGKQ